MVWYINSIESYSILDNTWTTLKVKLNYIRVFATAVWLDERVYVVGGTIDTDCIEYFDVSEGAEIPKWHKIVVEVGCHFFNSLLIPVSKDIRDQILILNQESDSQSVGSLSAENESEPDYDQASDRSSYSSDDFEGLGHYLLLFRKEQLGNENDSW